MKASEILTRARGLIDTPEKWTQTTSGRCGDRRCAGYAVEDAAQGHSYFRAMRLLEKECGGNVVAFNDDPRTTHADVLRAFDLAIAAAQRQETTP